MMGISGFRFAPGLFLFLISVFAIAPGLYGWQGSATRAAAENLARAGSMPEQWAVVDPANRLVPQVLLPLVHSVEVQAELGLDEIGLQRLEKIFSEIDGPWFRARIRPEAELRETIAGLERQLNNQLVNLLPAGKFQRLQQLELQAQASRLVHRPDVATYLLLDDSQMAAYRKLAEATDKVAKEIADAATSGKPVDNAPSKLKLAKDNETLETVRLLTEEQKTGLARITGDPMNLTTLARIYPMVPELMDTDGWIGTSPGTMESLRGKVVLVHFYAFQCINCRNNLPRYNEWASKFADDDVVIFGIQTPELPAERDAALIREAAEREKMDYPVLLDLQSKNWEAWSNTMWPTVYVIDRKGYIRFWWQGELNWQGAQGDKQIAELVERLLEEKQ